MRILIEDLNIIKVHETAYSGGMEIYMRTPEKVEVKAIVMFSDGTSTTGLWYFPVYGFELTKEHAEQRLFEKLYELSGETGNINRTFSSDMGE